MALSHGSVTLRHFHPVSVKRSSIVSGCLLPDNRLAAPKRKTNIGSNEDFRKWSTGLILSEQDARSRSSRTPRSQRMAPSPPEKRTTSRRSSAQTLATRGGPRTISTPRTASTCRGTPRRPYRCPAMEEEDMHTDRLKRLWLIPERAHDALRDEALPPGSHASTQASDKYRSATELRLTWQFRPPSQPRDTDGCDRCQPSRQPSTARGGPRRASATTQMRAGAPPPIPAIARVSSRPRSHESALGRPGRRMEKIIESIQSLLPLAGTPNNP